jgi:hypothetical protein
MSIRKGIDIAVGLYGSLLMIKLLDSATQKISYSLDWSHLLNERDEIAGPKCRATLSSKVSPLTSKKERRLERRRKER